jgi:hypothetical protein
MQASATRGKRELVHPTGTAPSLPDAGSRVPSSRPGWSDHVGIRGPTAWDSGESLASRPTDHDTSGRPDCMHMPSRCAVQIVCTRRTTC